LTNQDILKLQELLISRGETITCAESCTGGLIASKITQNSGSSAIFKGSIVTYCNEIKEQELNVQKETMIKYGVVSCEVVQEMCQGVLNKFDATYAIAVSGVAGPSGGTVAKPIGTVAIGVISKYKNSDIQMYHFEGHRDEVQKQATNKALSTVLKLIS